MFGGRHGNVHHLRSNAGLRLAAPASLAQRRAHCTLVGVVASESALQKVLPQTLLPNTKGKKKIWTAAGSALDPCGTIQIIPDNQGWVNSAKLIKIIDSLHRVCQLYDPTKKYVLVWDCHPTHISPTVLKHARQRHFAILLIPSKLTHLLQVLDFAVFASLKQQLHRAHLTRFIGARIASLPLHEWIDVTATCVAATMHRVDARAAFASAGQARRTEPYRAVVRKWVQAGWNTRGRSLTEEELWFLIGRKQRHIHRHLFPKLPAAAIPLAPTAATSLKRCRSKTTL